MRFERWVFRIAGIYGLLVLTPGYFLEEQIARDQPPAITHPEYYYGFLGVAIAWQVAFLTIALDPRRYCLLIPAAILEKATFGVAAMWLFVQGRLAIAVLGFAIIDLCLGVFFAVAFWRLLSLKERPDESDHQDAQGEHQAHSQHDHR